MTRAQKRGLYKGLRTVAQLVAGGSLTALISAVAGGLSPAWAAVLLGVWTAVVAGVQNTLETTGTIPTLLPTPPLD